MALADLCIPFFLGENGRLHKAVYRPGTTLVHRLPWCGASKCACLVIRVVMHLGFMR
jgi:hypothetical protein